MVEDDLPPDRSPRSGFRGFGDLSVGTDLSRILSLSDGVFAFAMTLLVLNIALPNFPAGTDVHAAGFPGQLAAALNAHLGAIAIYVLTFFVLGTWWVFHDRIFRVIRRYDPGLVRLNLAFLAGIAITPFSLQLVVDYPPTTVGVAWFAGIQAVCGALMLIIWTYATRHRRLVDADLPSRLILVTKYRALATFGVFVVAGLVGIVNPLVGLYTMVATYPVSTLVARWKGAKAPPASSPTAPPSGAPPGAP